MPHWGISILSSGYIPVGILRPTSSDKCFKGRALRSDFPAGTVAGQEPGLIRPGEDDLAHGLHGDGKILGGVCPPGSADEDRISNKNAPVAQVEAALAWRVSGGVDHLQAEIPNWDRFSPLKWHIVAQPK
jgi:hypothetical protein